MLEPEAVQAAVFSAAGEVQSMMNQLGLAARSAPTAKLIFESDLRASLRRALQFGRPEMVSVDATLSPAGILKKPSDVTVAGRTKTPQLTVEVSWHRGGEDQARFAGSVIWDILKMALARSRNAVEQATVLIAAPPRFWRWLPGYAEEHRALELLSPEPETPVSTKADFLAGPSWDYLFEDGMEAELPDRVWTSHLCRADVRSPWAEMELRLLEVKGLGGLTAVPGR